jgi:hypothetical protein
MSGIRHRQRDIALKAVVGLAGLALAAATAAYAAGVPPHDGGEARDSLGKALGGSLERDAVPTGPRPAAPAIVAHPPAVSTSAGAFFRFRVPRTASRSECKLDRHRWQACRSSVTYTSLPIGRHVFRVRAVAADGRRHASRYAWKRVETKPFSMIPDLSGLEPLYPGAAPIALPLRIVNPNPVPIVVTALRVAVANDPTDCDSDSNLELEPSDVSSRRPLRIPAGRTVRVPSKRILAPTIRLRDLPIDQDGCKDVSFPLTFSGTAHG